MAKRTLESCDKCGLEREILETQDWAVLKLECRKLPHGTQTKEMLLCALCTHEVIKTLGIALNDLESQSIEAAAKVQLDIS